VTSLNVWQAKYVIGAAIILPVSPFLYLQGRYTRRKIGLLPPASGDTTGVTGEGTGLVELLVIGESTVAGLGAKTHETALAGQFARRLSTQIRRPVRWSAIGKNGVTAKRTISELIPLVPEKKFDYILIGLGGNDVIKLSSPRKWRRTMIELIGILRRSSPDSIIFITNCAAVKQSPVLPEPIRFLLSQLSKMHNANAIEFTAAMDRVFYYQQPTSVPEGFFADGIHPSESGYSAWSESMMRFFSENFKW
ncbi:MAG: SGNH/GDSL hydrolase family protein, partial [Candidatus Binatia bacterium]